MNDPIRFPTMPVPIIGEPFTSHATWFVTAPIKCNCPAQTPLVVYCGNNLPPAVCPSCLNIYGVVALQGGGPNNLPLGVGIAVIGRATKNITDAQVETATKQIA